MKLTDILAQQEKLDSDTHYMEAALLAAITGACANQALTGAYPLTENVRRVCEFAEDVAEKALEMKIKREAGE